MKQIFDWLREQRVNTIELSDGRICVELSLVRELINEAEAKWESDCCEWKEISWNVYNAHERFCGDNILKEWTYCPYCGKPIKIVEVE